MKRTIVVVSGAFSLLFILLAFRGKETNTLPSSLINPGPVKEYTFSTTPTWSDEFSYTGKPNPEKWSYDLGGHGWGNNELQN
jgi:hypothetical protein